MKIKVLYDNQGNIISMGVPLPLAYDFRGPTFELQAEEGQHTAELEVPEQYASLELLQLAERLQVDVKSTPHKLTSKS